MLRQIQGRENQNRKWINNSNSEFEFAYIVITTYEKKSAFNGFKMTDLFGGKGVVSCIWPKENMPRDEYGNVADIVVDGGDGGIEPSTVVDCTGDLPVIIRQGKGELIY